jgi:tetratricopeptide (TPR) repeat protein
VTSRADDGHRRLIPRWRYTSQAVIGFEHSGDPREGSSARLRVQPLDGLVQQWQRDQTIESATELICASVVSLNFSDAIACAEWVLAKRETVPTEVVRAAQHICEHLAPVSALSESQHKLDSGRLKAREIIREGKQRLRDFPMNVARRMDMARAYTILNQAKAAKLQVQMALAIAPTHRMVLRSAVRLLIHFGKPEEALALITRNPRTRSDPWLLSQELSLSQILRKDPRLLRQATNVLTESGLHPGHLTELASAVGTFFGSQGDLKRSRKHHRYSLLNPTDNVLAQVGWLRSRDPALPKVPLTARPGAMESNLWAGLTEGEFDTAYESALAWYADEPYSARPAVAGSFIASSLKGDDATALQFLYAGLETDPAHPMLLNNLAVSQARVGSIEEACRTFLRIRDSERMETFVWYATRGLLWYALGDSGRGTGDYREALNRVPANSATELMVLSNWADTERRWSAAPNAELLAKVNLGRGKTTDAVAKHIAVRVLQSMDAKNRDHSGRTQPARPPEKSRKDWLDLDKSSLAAQKLYLPLDVERRLLRLAAETSKPVSPTLTNK